MSDSTRSIASETRLQLVAEIVDEMANQLQADLPVDVDAYVQRLPDLEQEIRDTYETLVRMQRLRDISPLATDNLDKGTLETFPAEHMIGEFRILRELGRGGMGVVYEAQQLSLDRNVAIKVLPFAALLDPKHLERFHNEARAAAMLKHRNIVSVHSVGCERGVHYYAMELIKGRSLAEFIADLKGERSTRHGDEADLSESATQGAETNTIFRLSTEHSTNRQSFYRSVAQLGVQASNALHFAHLAGVVHRDVKPSNLLLDQFATIHVADFGLAQTQTSESLTLTGDMIGTLRYMSPEQVEGHVVDERTDVYSLGATLFELLTLRPPFVEQNRHPLMRAITETSAPSPRSFSNDIPPDLANIIGKCLRKSPDERYPNAGELAEDLQRFLDHRSIKAKPISHTQRVRYFAKRNPATAWLLGLTFCLLALLALGSSGVAWKFSRDSQSRSQQLRQQQLVAYARDMHLAKSAIEAGAFQAAEQRLLKWVPQNGDIDDRGMEWYFLWRLGHPTDIQQSIIHETYAADVAFSPDGTLLADAFGNDAVPVWDLSKPGSPPVKILPCRATEILVVKTFARGDSDVLIAGDQAGNVYSWDWESLEPVMEPITVDTATSESSVRSINMDSTGKYLAVGAVGADDRGHVEIYDFTKRQCIFKKTQRTGEAYVGFDRQGRLVVASKGDPRVDTFELPTGQLIDSHVVDGSTSIATMSPDRSKIAINVERPLGSHRESWIEVRNLDTWTELFRFHLPEVKVRSMSFSQHGNQLAVGGYDGRLWQADLSTQTVASRRLHEGRITSVNFSPDDTILATTGTDKFIHLLKSAWSQTKSLQPIVRCQVLNVKNASGAAFLDDQTICTSREDRFVDIWNADSGERMDILELDPGFGTQVRLDAHPGQGLLAAGQMQWPVIKGQPGRVTIWKRAKPGEKLVMHRQVDIPYGVLSISMPFSPDGRYLAVCGRNRVTVIDILRPNAVPRVKEFFDGWVKSCAFSPDGETLACADTKDKTHFLDMETLESVREPFVTDSTYADCVAYIPGTNHLAAVGFDHELKIFDVGTGELLRKSERFPSFLATVRVSPDGSRIGVGAMDGKFRVFRTDDCQELINFDIPVSYCYCDFSSDSQSLVIAAGRDAFVVRGTNADRLSKLSVTEIKDIACKNLTYFDKPRGRKSKH